MLHDVKAFAATAGGRPVTAVIWLATMAFGALVLLDPGPFPRHVYLEATSVFTALTWLRTVGTRARLFV
ncbi:hypothetical protein [Haloarchaeobius iranensis]|uniref:Uncharacterized protein n=1 Tax=Haloarchaeobius iranensis TaxID=996166 RepID=A0A1G9SZ00_9EURY|nr:hypothetical protein [Haloarchaeobius iranensis]SDM40557.1 hypothetical protein SAMN05192554_10238 [Haloarchaeobius iranensis]